MYFISSVGSGGRGMEGVWLDPHYMLPVTAYLFLWDFSILKNIAKNSYVLCLLLWKQGMP